MRRSGGVAYVYAFERETGALRWKTAAGPGATTDLRTLGRLVFSVTLDDELLALDGETGEREWSFATGAANETFWLNSSPAVLGERVFFGGLDGVLYALDARSGRLLWRTELSSRISAGVFAGEGGVYAGTSDARLHRVHPESGEIVARIETEGAPTGHLALAEGCLLALLGDRSLACYAPMLEAARWVRGGAKPWTSSRPYVWRGLALAGSEAGELSAFRLRDGELVWSETISGTIRGIGTSSAGLYVGTLGGTVHARPWPRVSGSSPQ